VPKYLKKSRLPARPPVDVKLDIGPVGDQAGSLLQLMARERLIELNDRAIRLQWPERISAPFYQRLIGPKEATPMDRRARDGFTHVYRSWSAPGSPECLRRKATVVLLPV
jgi:hypothetical protein